MGFFNNMGNDIDITNVKVSKYINGTPKIDKWKKEKVDPVLDMDTKNMGKKWQDIYKKELWRVISEGLTEDMFDDNGNIDPNILKIVNIKLCAFREGWAAATEND